LPIKRNRHLMDCLRYLCNDLPEPLEKPAAPKTDLERHWDRLKPVMRKGSREDVWGDGYDN
jgi:hypothetical protein